MAETVPVLEPILGYAPKINSVKDLIKLKGQKKEVRKILDGYKQDIDTAMSPDITEVRSQDGTLVGVEGKGGSKMEPPAKKSKGDGTGNIHGGVSEALGLVLGRVAQFDLAPHIIEIFVRLSRRKEYAIEDAGDVGSTPNYSVIFWKHAGLWAKNQWAQGTGDTTKLGLLMDMMMTYGTIEVKHLKYCLKLIQQLGKVEVPGATATSKYQKESTPIHVIFPEMGASMTTDNSAVSTAAEQNSHCESIITGGFTYTNKNIYYRQRALGHIGNMNVGDQLCIECPEHCFSGREYHIGKNILNKSSDCYNYDDAQKTITAALLPLEDGLNAPANMMEDSLFHEWLTQASGDNSPGHYFNSGKDKQAYGCPELPSIVLIHKGRPDTPSTAVTFQSQFEESSDMDVVLRMYNPYGSTGDNITHLPTKVWKADKDAYFSQDAASAAGVANHYMAARRRSRYEYGWPGNVTMNTETPSQCSVRYKSDRVYYNMYKQYIKIKNFDS